MNDMRKREKTEEQYGGRCPMCEILETLIVIGYSITSTNKMEETYF